MGSIRLLLGKTRLRRRRAIPDEMLSGVDPYGHPTFLYVTDTWRKRALMQRTFRDLDCFSPPVRVFGELLGSLWTRHGDGRNILPQQALELIGDRLVATGAGRWPWLDSAGTSEEVGADLARLLLRTAESGRFKIEGSSHDGELNDALRALNREVHQLTGFITEPTALTALCGLLAAPPPTLLQWLRQTHSVVIDDILQPSPLRVAVLIALCRAWSAAGAHVVLSLETGRDLGGREAGFFFEYDDIDGYSLKPFAATRPLRKALFDAWIATGEASIHVAGERGVIEVEPWSPPAPAEAADLSDLIYGAASVPANDPAEAQALFGKISLGRASDPTAEIAAIADQVQRAIQDGQRPGGCVVALPDLDERASSVRHAFDARGIPHTIAAGMPLGRAPIAKALVRIATLALDSFPLSGLLQLLDQLHPNLPVPPMQLLEWCRAAGVRGGRPDHWLPTLVGWAKRAQKLDQLEAIRQTLEAMQPVCDTLGRLTQPMSPGDWREHLLGAAEELGLHADGSDRSLKVWAALLQTVDSLVLNMTLVSRESWPADRLAAHLQRSIERASWYPDPPSDERVAVVGVLELRGLTPERVWLGGLARGGFPRMRSGTGLIPGRLQRQLDPVDPLKEARYLLCSLLRNALGDPSMIAVNLSWPATRDGRHIAPSPVLADLLALPTTGGPALGDLVVSELGSDDRPPPSDPAWTAAQRDLRTQRTAPEPGVYSGILDRPPPLPPSIPVTAFEGYIRCPARYAYDRVLALRMEEEWSEELEPRRRGTALHRILERFLARRSLAPLAGERDRRAAAASLHSVACEVLDEVEADGGFEPIMQAYARSRWLAGLIDETPAGLLKAWLDSEIDAGVPASPLGVEIPFSGLDIGPIRLRGSIDRVDRVAGTLAITDYKTGTAPSQRQVALGLALQPVAYAEALARLHPGMPVTASFLTLKKPDNLRRTKAIDLSDSAREPLWEAAAEDAENLAAGRFPTTAHRATDAGCAWCPHRRICRVDHSRGPR